MQGLAKVDPKVLYAAAAILGLVVLYLGAHTSYVGVFVLVTCFVMLVFAGWLAQWVMAKDEGTVDMQEVLLTSLHCLKHVKPLNLSKTRQQCLSSPLRLLKLCLVSQSSADVLCFLTDLVD